MVTEAALDAYAGRLALRLESIALRADRNDGTIAPVTYRSAVWRLKGKVERYNAQSPIEDNSQDAPMPPTPPTETSTPSLPVALPQKPTTDDWARFGACHDTYDHRFYGSKSEVVEAKRQYCLGCAVIEFCDYINT